jgi:hypothetical protein
MVFVVDLLKRAQITDLEILSVIAADILNFLSPFVSGRFYRACQMCFRNHMRSMTAEDKFTDGETAGGSMNAISPATDAHFAGHAAHPTRRTASLNNLARVSGKRADSWKTDFLIIPRPPLEG